MFERVWREEEMYLVFLTVVFSLAYSEAVYHVSIAGGRGMSLLLAVPAVLSLAGVELIALSIGKHVVNKWMLWAIQIVNFLLFASQLIYMRIFMQPLLIAAAVNAGGAALKNYWRELLYAIGQNFFQLLLLAAPLLATGILLRKKRVYIMADSKHETAREHMKCRSFGIASAAIGLSVTSIVLLVGSEQGYSYYEEFQSFYDPAMVAEEYGVLALMQRDLMGDALQAIEEEADYITAAAPVFILSETLDMGSKEAGGQVKDGEDEGDHLGETEGTEGEKPNETERAEGGNPGEAVGAEGEALEETVGMDGEEPGEAEAGQGMSEAFDEKTALPQTLEIDFEKLHALTAGTDAETLVSYMETRTPTKTNAYTGMFQGYNLIYLTAEGFSPYAVSEELTPTLYRLSHNGFVAENYYVPLWQTSTSDGEYVNLTGQIPYRQFSMKKTSDKLQPYSLPAYFKAEGVKSFAYHNNSLSYYDRHLSHPNLGYDFKASRLGDLSASQWGGQVFEMENAGRWPASDLDMVTATLPEYIQEDRFHVYYMTVSGHMNYNFSGNAMSYKNRDLVAGLSCSEEGKAYIACNIELDRALEYLIEELEKAGKLENTVIALSADHYPYGMSLDHYEELAGRELKNSLELYRNTLILWNSQMEEPVVISKPCGAMDLLPTLYNLFGFKYDSRLFAGTDMLSDSPGLVVFSDRSFITDEMTYNKKTGKTSGTEGEEVEEDAVKLMKQKVKKLYEYSNGILVNDFFRYVEDARIRPADPPQ